jgi:hypothetical protein
MLGNGEEMGLSVAAAGRSGIADDTLRVGTKGLLLDAASFLIGREGAELALDYFRSVAVLAVFAEEHQIQIGTGVFHTNPPPRSAGQEWFKVAQQEFAAGHPHQGLKDNGRSSE